jgi:hypothetical protein
LAHRLAESVIRLCDETAGEFGMSVACVLGGLTLALGRIAGRAARDNGAQIDEAVGMVLQHLWRIANREYFRAANGLH